MTKNTFFLLAAILFNCSIFPAVACAEDQGVVKTIGEYLGKLNGYIKYSNELILAKIGDADIETDELYKLRSFNINMEICKDYQVLSERYHIYLLWMADLYRIRQENTSNPALDKIIKKARERILINLKFDTEEYIPGFISDITDKEVLKFSNDLSETLKRLYRYLASITP